MFEQPVVNTTYLSAVPLTDHVTGDAIAVGFRGAELTIFFQIPSISGTPNGLISLQGSLDGSTWKDIPGAFSEFRASTAGALSVEDRVCVWSGLNFHSVRLKYTRSSGGTANTITAQYRLRA